MAALEHGDTAAVEALFTEIETRTAGEAKAAKNETAEAARHRGALAYLRDTEKALGAYRHAVELHPESMDGWNQLGHLYQRVGQLNDSEAAYKKWKLLQSAPQIKAVTGLYIKRVVT